MYVQLTQFLLSNGREKKAYFGVLLYIDTEIVKKSKISTIGCDMELQGSNFVCQIDLYHV